MENKEDFALKAKGYALMMCVVVLNLVETTFKINEKNVSL